MEGMAGFPVYHSGVSYWLSRLCLPHQGISRESYIVSELCMEKMKYVALLTIEGRWDRLRRKVECLDQGFPNFCCNNPILMDYFLLGLQTTWRTPF